MHQHNGESMLYCEQKSTKIIKYLTEGYVKEYQI